MKLFIFLSLSLSFALHASEVQYKCQELVDGNFNKISNMKIKSIDAQINLNVEDQTASLRGDMIVANTFRRMGSYYEAGQKMYSIGELDNNLRLVERLNIIRVTNYRRDIFCQVPENPCRIFETLTFDTNTKEALYERQYSYNPIVGSMISDSSIKFKCVIK